MLVEKLICNARLNLLILHPFPTPSQLPQQTEAQWPIYTKVPWNKNIYLQKGGGGLRGGRVEKGDRERETKRGTECRPTCHRLGQLRGGERGGGINVLLASSHSNPSPIPIANLYLLALYIHLSVSKQNMLHPPS